MYHIILFQQLILLAIVVRSYDAIILTIATMSSIAVVVTDMRNKDDPHFQKSSIMGKAGKAGEAGEAALSGRGWNMHVHVHTCTSENFRTHLACRCPSDEHLDVHSSEIF